MQPRGFNIDPEGKYLLALGEKSNGLSTYDIDEHTGALRNCRISMSARVRTGSRSLHCLVTPDERSERKETP